MSQIRGLIDLVQDAISKGAASVEEVHRSIANQPLELLKQIQPLESSIQGFQDFQNQTIGGIYESIRSINQQAGEIARDLLSKVEKPENPSA
ncbi:MAG TPA: hypothetical protein PL048_02185 [Leptospiraceae bacterium]|nr:hypothetical protein [Leptospiraceae bacterium]HMY65070.1 hypothetical protein [Leptospiraceae bacterium]HMZ57553.1 hypothetical protein [Leptospiraceae bacterium]HNF12656.1 hypothetical protein [Leptospiraceae bacterium]HNF24181.1 hypothetical protein [Leptospiraceae bacterium]